MSATTNAAIGEDTRSASRIAWTTARVAIAVGSVWGAFRLLTEWWRVAEAQLVVMTLHLVGIGAPERAGDQILVLGGPGTTFSAAVGPWCSSLGVVLALLAYATIVATGDRGRRRRAFVRGAALVVIGNLVRIGATIVVGVTSGPGSIESFHDSIATGFAVLYVLAGFAVFVVSLGGQKCSSSVPSSDVTAALTLDQSGGGAGDRCCGDRIVSPACRARSSTAR